jgi:hypothetical protein
MTQDEWGPWIDHDGRGCPCVGKYSQWEMCSDIHWEIGTVDISGRIIVSKRVIEGIAKNGSVWSWKDGFYHVIRYRIRKPRGMAILEKLLTDLTETVDA